MCVCKWTYSTRRNSSSTGLHPCCLHKRCNKRLYVLPASTRYKSQNLITQITWYWNTSRIFPAHMHPTTLIFLKCSYFVIRSTRYLYSSICGLEHLACNFKSLNFMQCVYCITYHVEISIHMAVGTPVSSFWLANV